MWGLADITAVVTCFESADLLRKAVDSIRAQGPIRIVLVDDGSESCACRDIAEAHEHLVRIDRDNGGHAAALNTGVSHVRTEVIAFLDDDDEWLPGKAQHHLQLLTKTGADIVAGGVRNIHDDGQAPTWTVDFPATRLLGATTGLTRAVRRVGPFAEHTRHHCIVDWWSRADRVGLVRVDDNDPVLLRRIHGRNSGVVHRVEARRDLLHHVRAHVTRRAAS